MALRLFDGPPDLLPLADLLGRHRAVGLTLTEPVRFYGAGGRGVVVLEGALKGRPLVTELLRLAAIGSAFLSAAADRPHLAAGELKRELRAGDADILLYLDGR